MKLFISMCAHHWILLPMPVVIVNHPGSSLDVTIGVGFLCFFLGAKFEGYHEKEIRL